MANFLRMSLIGVDALLKQIGTRAGAPIASAVNQQMLLMAVEIEAKAKARCPRDTGELASSITHTRTPIQVEKLLVWKVGTNLWYAPSSSMGPARLARRALGWSLAFLRRRPRGLRFSTSGEPGIPGQCPHPWLV